MPNLPNYQYGSSVFGSKPTPAPIPDLLAELRKAIPGYGSITSQLSQNLMYGLKGQLSPEEQRYSMDASNAKAVGGGFKGGGLDRNLTYRDLGIREEDVRQKAFGQALNYITNQRNTAVLDPGLRAEIEKYNSLINAAPDPVARGNFELDQFNKALDRQAKSPIFNPSQGQSAGASTTGQWPLPTTQPGPAAIVMSGSNTGVQGNGNASYQGMYDWQNGKTPVSGNFAGSNFNGESYGGFGPTYQGDFQGPNQGSGEGQFSQYSDTPFWLSGSGNGGSQNYVGQSQTPYYDYYNDPSALFDSTIYGGSQASQDPFDLLYDYTGGML